MKAVICIAAALLSFGCSGWRFYAHDRGLEERLKNVEQQFADLSRAQSSVWAVMQSNLEAAARRESEALRRDAANRRAATIGSLDGLKWSVVKLDADKIRNRASDNLETLSKKIPPTIDELEQSRAAIKKVTPDPKTGSSSASVVQKVPKADTADTKTLTDYIDEAEKYLASARDDVRAAFEGKQQDGLRKLLVVARKAKDASLVKTIPELFDAAAQAAKDPSKVQLPQEAQDAARLYLKKDFTTFGQVIEFFEGKEGKGSEVALALANDFERTLLEIRGAKVKTLEERLRLLNAQLIVEQQRQITAAQVSSIASRYSGAVRDSLDEWFKRSDDDFRTGLRDVIAYVQLSGSLSALSDMLTNDLAVLDHRERMRLDEIATSAQARLATLGLQGVASFAEGGITEEQIANWLRALQVIGVGVIGGRI